jgi:hypothetical protein
MQATYSSIALPVTRILGIPVVNGKIIGLELQSGFRMWHENTSTSPSGLHLGHDKAMLHHIIQTETSSFLDDYFDHKARMINLAIDHRHVYKRWQMVITTMIEKIPGTPRLDKLRVIHIIESDFNLWMGIVWGRRLIHQAEDLELLEDEQSGSRPGRKCQDVVIFKHMTYSINRMSRTDCITFDNDAKSCFDRIVMVCASLITQRYGMDTSVIELVIKTLSQIKYFAKTYCGISEVPYQVSESHGVHGPGQGGRASPAIWTIISCFLLQCMRENTAGATLESPYGQQLRQVSTGFVDDITHWCCTMGRTTIPPKTLLHEMSHSAQLWEQLLHLTGGKLELSKCFYYPVFWKFDSEGVPALTPPTEIDLVVQVTDSETKTSYVIESKEGSESHKTLGVMESPGGNYKEEHHRLQQKALHHAQILASSILQYKEMKTYYQSIYLPSMQYSLIVGTFSENQAHLIQIPVTQVVLTGLGYCSKTPSALVYGPPSIGGIGLRHLFAEQGTLKTQALIQNIRGNTKLGKIMLMQLQWAQLICGSREQLLVDVETDWPMLKEELWITSLRDFLKKSELSIHIPAIKTATPKRINDFSIMDKAASLGFKPYELLCINRCRIYLKATTISNICTADGTEIRYGIQECSEEARIQSFLLWPRQERPGPKSIQHWKRFLKRICRTDTKRLTLQLSHWHNHAYQKPWDAYYDFQNDTLTTTDSDNKIVQFHSASKHRKQWVMSSPTQGNENWTPTDSHIPVDVLHYSGSHCKISIPVYNLNQQAPSPVCTWYEYVERLPAWESSLIKHMSIQVYTPIQHFSQQNNLDLYIVSDGSVRADKGTFAWVIGSDTKIFITGQGSVFGNRLSSYRAEICGMLAWMQYIYHYSKFLNMNILCNLRPFCDNKTAVDNLNASHPIGPKDAMSPDYDILCEARHSLKQLRLQMNVMGFSHVKGHQDQNKKVVELSREASLNIEADKLANEAMQTWCNLGSQEVAQNPIFLKTGSDIITSDELNTLRWRWREILLQDYYAEKFHTSVRNLHSINWAALRIARTRMPLKMRQFSIKLTVDILATGSRLKLYGNLNTACHLCSQEETNVHLFSCPNRSTQREKMYKSLTEQFNRNETERAMTQAIIEGMQRWVNSEKEDPGTQYITSQNDLVEKKSAPPSHFCITR